MIENDPSSILISIKNIKKQLLIWLQKLTIPMHFGDNLKITFNS